MPPNSSQSQNQYDFILNNSPTAPNNRFGGAGSSKKVRILIVAGGVILLIIVAAVVINLLGNAGRAQAQKLTDVARSQTELVRVTTLSKSAKDLNTISLATTTKLSVATSLNNTKQLLGKRGLGSKELGKALSSTKNTKTDTALSEATQNNRFDETFLKILDSQLSEYKKLLTAAHGGANASEKKLIEAEIKNIEAIQKQVQKKPGAPLPVKASDVEESATPEE